MKLDFNPKWEEYFNTFHKAILGKIRQLSAELTIPKIRIKIRQNILYFKIKSKISKSPGGRI